MGDEGREPPTTKTLEMNIGFLEWERTSHKRNVAMAFVKSLTEAIER
jgi:hypothetical protein